MMKLFVTKHKFSLDFQKKQKKFSLEKLIITNKYIKKNTQ